MENSMAFHWPWARSPGTGAAAPERKASAGSGWGFIALHRQGEALWTRRDYASVAREGYMLNPVAHRAVRMVAEAAAAVPWLLYEGAAELSGHEVLDLLARPNQRQGGAAFMEMLYGHLLLSGNAYPPAPSCRSRDP
jgi:phage portal protein BeeE